MGKIFLKFSVHFFGFIHDADPYLYCTVDQLSVSDMEKGSGSATLLYNVTYIQCTYCTVYIQYSVQCSIFCSMIYQFVSKADKENVSMYILPKIPFSDKLFCWRRFNFVDLWTSIYTVLYIYIFYSILYIPVCICRLYTPTIVDADFYSAFCLSFSLPSFMYFFLFSNFYR